MASQSPNLKQKQLRSKAHKVGRARRVRMMKECETGFRRDLGIDLLTSSRKHTYSVAGRGSPGKLENSTVFCLPLPRCFLHVARLLETAIFERTDLVSGLNRRQIRYNSSLFPTGNICIAGVAQLVEHDVANVVVEGSSPFTRFFVASRSPYCGLPNGSQQALGQSWRRFGSLKDLEKVAE